MSALDLAPYLALLRRGGVLACPTETLYGLLADALDPQAVARVVALKQRGPDPIALLVPDLAAAQALAAGALPERAVSLAAAHWPGPLTLVIKARPGLSPALAPAGTVGVRVPGPSAALALVQAFGGPLTATSCNPSGQPAARSEPEARAYFGDRLDGYVPGSAPGGLPSTLVDVSGSELRVLRQGALRID